LVQELNRSESAATSVELMNRDEVRFGQFRLDVRQRKLTRGGEAVRLGSRALEILCVLASAQGDVVSKDDLMARVWPGIVVEENNIQVHVSALRKAIEEGKAGASCLVTVPGRGYRLIGVEPFPPAADGHVDPHPLPLPDRPSIAVLPFQNMSGDAEQEYFADGVVEEIITALSRFSSLFVIARNSTFAYKGRAVDVTQISRELGVRYVLEGSVRKADHRVRITAQLIDSASHVHLWADRFDGALTDILELQDQLTTNVVSAIAPKVEQAEIARAKRKPTDKLEAYDFFLRGLECSYQDTEASSREALQLFARAIELDSEFASAYGWASYCYVLRKRGGWLTDVDRDIAEASHLAWKAVQLGKDDAVALSRGGNTLAYLTRELSTGATFVDRARKLNPNLAFPWYVSGWIKVWMGEPEIALTHFAQFERMSPLDPEILDARSGCAFAHFHAGRYEEAALIAEQVLQESPHRHVALRIAVASNSLAGRIREAQQALASLRQVDPSLTVSNLGNFTWRRRPEDVARYVEAMRKAGLPE
jgi:TolB-like protein